jgi:hypothetical protein
MVTKRAPVHTQGHMKVETWMVQAPSDSQPLSVVHFLV